MVTEVSVKLTQMNPTVNYTIPVNNGAIGSIFIKPIYS